MLWTGAQTAEARTLVAERLKSGTDAGLKYYDVYVKFQ